MTATALDHTRSVGDPVSAVDRKIVGWDWVVRELAAQRERALEEALRLLGPDRGE